MNRHVIPVLMVTGEDDLRYAESLRTVGTGTLARRLNASRMRGWKMNDTRHQCRWCASLCTGNGIYCSEKQKCLSESHTKRVNKCPDFQFVNMDAYTFEEYKPRVRHNKNIEGQVSIFSEDM